MRFPAVFYVRINADKNGLIRFGSQQIRNKSRYLDKLDALPQIVNGAVPIYGICDICEAVTEQTLSVVFGHSVLFAQIRKCVPAVVWRVLGGDPDRREICLHDGT